MYAVSLSHTHIDTHEWPHNEHLAECERERCSSINTVSKWTMALGPHSRPWTAELKLEQLTGAAGPQRSQAPLGPEWKYHYHISHGCPHMDHSLTTRINMGVCVCVWCGCVCEEREAELDRVGDNAVQCPFLVVLQLMFALPVDNMMLWWIKYGIKC